MPAYSFQKQFIPMILSGRKTTTIRKTRGRPTKAGDWIRMFTGMRTKQCLRIGHAHIVSVVPITIWPFECKTKLGGYIVPPGLDSRNAQKDGFADLDSYYKFFQRYKREVLDNFEVITWDFGTLWPYVFREDWPDVER